MWRVSNVGSGPALDVLFAKRPKNERDWVEPKRLPPLAVNTYVDCPNGYELCCDYCDADGRRYTSKCKDYKSTVDKGGSLPTWPEDKITKESAIPNRL
jgi:hypothetical protein